MSVPKTTLFAFLILQVNAITVSSANEEFSRTKKAVVIDFTTTQTSYSDSWVGGEAGSVNWVANLHGSASRKMTERLEVRTDLKLSFGQTLTQDEETKEWAKPKKSTDLIDWETVGSISSGKLVDPYLAFRAQTQFYDGSNRLKKLYLSPMKLTESAGITRKFYETEKELVISRLGLGIRQIRTRQITDTLTLTTESSTSTDAGIESVSEAALKLHENIRYNGKLTLYKAFSSSRSDDVAGTPDENEWKAVDVNLENTVSAAVSSLLTVNLYLQLLYDKEVSRQARLKETLAIGFVFRMI